MHVPAAATNWNRFQPSLVSIVLLGMAFIVLVSLSGCGSFAARGLNADAVRQFEDGQYARSIERCHDAIRNDPKNPDSYYNLGAVYHRLGSARRSEADYQKAETYYNQCLGYDMDHAECHRGLAVMLAEQGRVEEAFRLLEGWADRRSDLPEPKVELARLLEKTGDRKAAKECLTEALAVNPNHARVRAELARVQEQMGETQEALANYYRSYQQDRFQPEVAARIAALQSTLPAPAAPINVETPEVRKETRLASRSTGTLR